MVFIVAPYLLGSRHLESLLEVTIGRQSQLCQSECRGFPTGRSFHNQALHVIVAFGVIHGTKLVGTLPQSGLCCGDESLTLADACTSTCVHALDSARTGSANEDVRASTLRVVPHLHFARLQACRHDGGLGLPQFQLLASTARFPSHCSSSSTATCFSRDSTPDLWRHPSLASVRCCYCTQDSNGSSSCQPCKRKPASVTHVVFRRSRHQERHQVQLGPRLPWCLSKVNASVPEARLFDPSHVNLCGETFKVRTESCACTVQSRLAPHTCLECKTVSCVPEATKRQCQQPQSQTSSPCSGVSSRTIRGQVLEPSEPTTRWNQCGVDRHFLLEGESSGWSIHSQAQSSLVDVRVVSQTAIGIEMQAANSTATTTVRRPARGGAVPSETNEAR